jgi:hypothetical protein
VERESVCVRARARVCVCGGCWCVQVLVRGRHARGGRSSRGSGTRRRGHHTRPGCEQPVTPERARACACAWPRPPPPPTHTHTHALTSPHQPPRTSAVTGSTCGSTNITHANSAHAAASAATGLLQRPRWKGPRGNAPSATSSRIAMGTGVWCAVVAAVVGRARARVRACVCVRGRLCCA